MNCSSLHLKTVAAILFVAANATNTARAQMTDPQAPPPRESMLVWPVYRPTPGEKIIVVTVKEPTVRHTCKVQEFSTDRILCSQRHHAEPILYSAQDVIALIRPSNINHSWLLFAGIFGIGGGIITGACFLASVAIVLAIPVAILGGVVVLGSFLAFGDEEPGPRHDTVIYQRPGTTLAVTLR